MSVNIISSVARVALLFSQDITIVPVLAIGYHFISKRVFSCAACVLFFMMIFNTYLKSIWQIPLPEHVGPGWAFPSGHMASAVVFWGYLGLEYKNKFFRMAIVSILLGVATALIYFGYHTLRDVLGAWLFSSMVLIIFRKSCLRCNDKNLYKLFLAASCVGALLIWMLPKALPHTWVALGGLILLIIAARCHLTTGPGNRKSNIKKIVLLGAGVPGLYGVSQLLINSYLYNQHVILAVLYLTITAWIVLVVDLVAKHKG